MRLIIRATILALGVACLAAILINATIASGPIALSGLNNTVLGVLAALLTLAYNAVVREEQLSEEKAKLALDFSHRWNSAMPRARGVVQELRKRDTDERKLTYIDADETRTEHLLEALNFFETLSVAVRRGLVDEKICKTLFARAVVAYWRETKPFVDRRRGPTTAPITDVQRG